MADTLTVWWNAQRVGTIALNEFGEPEFSYCEHWLSSDDARAVSQSLPLQSDPFDRRATLPFFEGLLPEAAQRTAIARALGVSERNEFRLLEQLGGELAGALEIWPGGAPPPVHSGQSASAALSEDDLKQLIARLPVRPMMAGGETGLRLSLAGAQSKLPVILIEGRIALPQPGQMTTHILKPEIASFEGTSENEALCMTLAAAIGLDVAAAEYLAVDDVRFILVERYDRAHSEKGELQRLHQEDFCQALGFTSARKYAADGGPVFRDCFDLLRRAATRPAADALKLLDAAIFNAVIGNADAHAKNFSLLYNGGETQLAPLYDLLSTVAYADLSQRFAMKIGGKRGLEDCQAADWLNFAGHIGISGPFVLRRAAELSQSVIDKMDDSVAALRAAGGRPEFAQKYGAAMTERASLLIKQLT